MGILSKIQRDIIQGDVENNEYKHQSLYKIDFIIQNQEQWGLHILEILTFIARKFMRKGFSIVNQFQIYLTSIQFDKENSIETSFNQQQIHKTQTFSNKISLIPRRSYTTNPEQQPLPPDCVEKAEDTYQELDSNKSYVVDGDSIYTRGNSQIITKKVIYSDNEEDWRSVEEKQRYDDNQNDSSYIDDSQQHTYYLESEDQEEKNSMNHSMKYPVYQVHLTNDVKYVTEEISYFLGNQTRVLNQDLILNMDPDIKEIINYYNQYQLQTDMQSITKAQLQNRFDTRESCISIWITTINSGLYNAIKRFSQAITSIYDNIDNELMLQMVNMNKGQLAEHIKTKTNSTVENPEELEGFIRLFNIDILKNVTASEKCCLVDQPILLLSSQQDRDICYMPKKTSLLPKKCFNPNNYYKIQKQIAHKDLKFSLNVKHFDTQFKFKDLGDHVQIKNQNRGKKGRSKKKKTNRTRGKGKGRRGRR